jgi:hypothetical protein
VVFRAKGPRAGTQIKLRCANCGTWICSYYEYPAGSGVVHPRFDKRIRNVERISPDREPVEEALFVFRCPQRKCQRAHLLRGATVATCCRGGLRGTKHEVTLPDDDG